MQSDIQRIRTHIEVLTKTVRPAESEQLAQCRQYVSGLFEEYGWTVTRSPFVAQTRVKSYAPQTTLPIKDKTQETTNEH